MNPILRLGKDASNYAELLRKSTISRLQINHRLVKHSRPTRDKTLNEKRERLLAGLENAGQAYESIDVSEIASIQQQSAQLCNHAPELRALVEDQELALLVEDFGELTVFLRSTGLPASLLCGPGSRPDCLLRIHDRSRLAAISLAYKTAGN